MSHHESYRLQLGNFESSIHTFWKNLQNEIQFCDVILACEGRQLMAHRVIISSVSPVLSNILKQSQTISPIIYLTGVKYRDLENLLSFIYQGEILVSQEDFYSFTKLAGDLKIVGFSQTNEKCLNSNLELESSSKRKETEIIDNTVDLELSCEVIEGPLPIQSQATNNKNEKLDLLEYVHKQTDLSVSYKCLIPNLEWESSPKRNVRMEKSEIIGDTVHPILIGQKTKTSPILLNQNMFNQKRNDIIDAVPKKAKLLVSDECLIPNVIMESSPKREKREIIDNIVDPELNCEVIEAPLPIQNQTIDNEIKTYDLLEYFPQQTDLSVSDKCSIPNLEFEYSPKRNIIMEESGIIDDTVHPILIGQKTKISPLLLNQIMFNQKRNDIIDAAPKEAKLSVSDKCLIPNLVMESSPKREKREFIDNTVDPELNFEVIEALLPIQNQAINNGIKTYDLLEYFPKQTDLSVSDKCLIPNLELESSPKRNIIIEQTEIIDDNDHPILISQNTDTSLPLLNQIMFNQKSYDKIRPVPKKAKLSCNQCDKTYTDSSNLKRHKIAIHDKIRLQCNQCEFTAKYSSHLKNHVKYIHENVPVYCDMCDKQFSSPNTLNKHKQSIHELVFYPCNQCDRKFTGNGGLYEHKKSVHEGRTFPCNKCNYKASQKTSLKAHIQSKHGDTAYSCQKCNYTSSLLISLKRHTNYVHNGIFYPCKNCDYKATTKGSLKSHFESIHEKISHSCNKCEKQFSDSSGLRKHTLAIHEGLCFPCDYCKFVAVSKQTLTIHIKRDHDAPKIIK